MNESTLRRIADRLVESGLKDLGYQYLNLDDCWAKSRRGDGTLVADEAKFPDGTLKPLADYVHSKGLLLGTYTDRGEQTCAGRPGAARHEELDAKTYAAWGIDYLKEDRPKERARSEGVLQNIDIMNGLETYAGPGGWNDPCLLLSKKTTGEAIMTELQTRAQFSMWAVLAAPLLISGSVLNMSAETLATYSNKEVIQVSQDPLGRQGRRVLGGPVAEGTGNVFARPLADGSFALVFLNSGKEELNDKVAGHFAKFGQVNHVEIKKQPDGTSRGFCFVTFAEKVSVSKVLQAHSSHMIDNKWVDVKPQVASMPKKPSLPPLASKKEKHQAKDTQDEYESGFAEKYLQAAAAMQGGGGDDSSSKETKEGDENQMGKMMKAMMSMMPMMMGVDAKLDRAAAVVAAAGVAAMALAAAVDVGVVHAQAAVAVAAQAAVRQAAVAAVEVDVAAVVAVAVAIAVVATAAAATAAAATAVVAIAVVVTVVVATVVVVVTQAAAGTVAAVAATQAAVETAAAAAAETAALAVEAAAVVAAVAAVAAAEIVAVVAVAVEVAVVANATAVVAA
eukprot:g18313.t1